MAINRMLGGITAPVVLAVAFAGCHSEKQNQPAASQAQSQPAEDPAAANLASAVADTTAGQNAPTPPDTPGLHQPGSEQTPYVGRPAGASGRASRTAYEAAPKPPPELPDYEQPPCPAQNDIWTPGYWSYAPQGYYWVPGAWVMPPFIGALWTPGYWAYDKSHYRWHPGYWGQHIGYYGGISYGHGYDGRGYEGGYWRDGQFYYNRDVTRINETAVRNVYSYRVKDHPSTTRISYNGGPGGLPYAPTAQQQAAEHEKHFEALPVQQQLHVTARQRREQFARYNHGQPAITAESQPLHDGRSAPAPDPQQYQLTTEAPPANGAPGSNYVMGPRTTFGGETLPPQQDQQRSQRRRYPTGLQGPRPLRKPRGPVIPRPVRPTESGSEQQTEQQNQQEPQSRGKGQEQSPPQQNEQQPQPNNPPQ